MNEKPYAVIFPSSKLSAKEVEELKRLWQERYVSHVADVQRPKHAAEVWKRRYQELASESVPHFLWRRLLVLFTRLLGRLNG